MRLDRLLAVGLYRSLASTGLERAGGALPILMYHSITEDAEAGVHPYYRVCTSPGRFKEQMQWLADHGWRGVSLTDALRPNAISTASPSASDDGVGEAASRGPAQTARRSASARANSVVLSFDDGYQDFADVAFPVLERLGFGATVYLPTAYVDSSRRQFKSRACLTWKEVQELRTQGIEFGSHTVSHPKLYELAWPEIRRELIESKSTIEDHLQSEVSSFCYPYAFPQTDLEFAQGLLALLQEAGYESSVTTQIGRAHPSTSARVDRRRESTDLSGGSATDRRNVFGERQHLLPRLPANSDDDPALLAAKLHGAYDWLGRLQGWWKSVKRGGKGRKAFTPQPRTAAIG